MEKFNYFLKALIGVLLIISFVMTFSSCEKKHEGNIEDTTSPVSGQIDSKTPTAPSTDTSSSWTTIKDKVNKEEKELDSKLMELETKASAKSEKVKKEVKKSTDKIKSDKSRIKSDSIKPEFKEEWDSFKMNAEKTVDSLKAKLK